MKIFLLYFSGVLFFVMNTAFSPNEKKPLSVTVTNIRGAGQIRLGLYKPGDKFPEFNSGRGYIADPKEQNSVTISIPDADYGEYAVAVFHDKDGDGKLNTKIFGMPAEPFGFSNNIKPRFSAPKYDKCRFTYNGDNYHIYINLIEL